MYNEYYDEPRETKSKIKDSSYSMTKVFGWMFYAILVTFGAAIGVPYLLAAVGGANLYTPILIGSAIALFVLCFLSHWLILNAKSAVTAVSIFTLFAICMGVTISSILLVVDLTSVVYALGVTAGIFGIMALYGAFTKKDLVGFGNFLIMFLMGALIISIINFFIGSSVLDFVISYVILGIYIGFIAYDVQNVKKLANSGQLTTNVSLMMALNLYIDFIYVFIRLVEIIYVSRRN